MSVVYVKEQGAYVSKSGERILVMKDRQRLLEMPVFQLENLALLGNVQITTQALHMLMKEGVDVSFLSRGGQFLGRAGAESSKNIFLRFEQYSLYQDQERSLALARQVTDNKICNQINMIRSYRWSGTEYDWRADVKRMEEYRVTMPERKTTNEILGVEGICSNVYFRAFGKMLKGDFSFSGRNRRPPKDPVNVLISLTYTFLTRELDSMLDAESFEPYLGFLHGVRYGRKSLALDLVEEFRQPVADRFVLMLLNKRMISEGDFEFPEEGVLLNDGGFRKFCTEYERWMTGRNSNAGSNSFRKKMQEQVAALKKAIMKKEPYVPYRWEREEEDEGTVLSGEL